MLYVINPIAGTMVDTHLRNSFTNRLNIPRIASSQPLNACLNARTCADILQAINPLSEVFGFANFNQDSIVVQRIQFVNEIVSFFMVQPTK